MLWENLNLNLALNHNLGGIKIKITIKIKIKKKATPSFPTNQALCVFSLFDTDCAHVRRSRTLGVRRLAAALRARGLPRLGAVGASPTTGKAGASSRTPKASSAGRTKLKATRYLTLIFRAFALGCRTGTPDGVKRIRRKQCGDPVVYGRKGNCPRRMRAV